MGQKAKQNSLKEKAIYQVGQIFSTGGAME